MKKIGFILLFVERITRAIITMPFIIIGFFWGIISFGISVGKELDEKYREWVHDKINEKE